MYDEQIFLEEEKNVKQNDISKIALKNLY